MVKKRADIYLTEIGIAGSREQARRLILEGKVFANGIPVSKPASLINVGSHINLLKEETSYVSRGGLKLEKALHVFNIHPVGKLCLDIGASTGGFTDCLLRHGARQVVAIDVGYGQLAWSLRNDPRVIVMERTNIRNVTPGDLPQLADLATIDVSFISLVKIFEIVSRLINANGEIISLIKPQFEAGRERVGKKGVVRDAGVHRDVLEHIWEFYTQHGAFVKGLTYSPIKGPEGNIEFLLYASMTDDAGSLGDKDAVIDKVVSEAHGELREGNLEQ